MLKPQQRHEPVTGLPSVRIDLSEHRRPQAVSPWSFSFQSLMLLMLLVALALTAAQNAPKIASLFFYLAVPALLRTLMVVYRRRRSRGRHCLTAGDAVGVYINSLALVTLIAATSVWAFAITSLPLGSVARELLSEEAALVASIAVGLVAGLLIGVLMIRLLWYAGE